MRPRLAFVLPLLLAAAFVAGCGEPEPALAPVSVSPVPAPHPAAEVVERLGFSVRLGPLGLVIVALDLDGPAALAGTRVGDVVVRVNGAAPADAAELQRLVKASPGSLQLDFSRQGAAHQVAIRLVDPQAAQAAWTPLGLQVREVPESARKALEVSHGVMVTKMRAPADRTRILPGDVIVAVDGHKVEGVAAFERLVERAAARRSGAVGLLVKRADSDLFVPIDPAEMRAGSSPGEASRGGGAPRPEEIYRRRNATGTPLRT